MAPSLMEELGIKPSTTVVPSNIKFLFWGDKARRKTETILRNFPHVLFIDVEGNAVHCTQMPEIKPFLYVKTKDVNKILKILDGVAEGKIKMPDGSPVETVAIDTVSVIWGVQQEVASTLAKRRAAKKNWNVDEAKSTMLDWNIAKRPLKKIYNRLNGTTIKYLILTAREKDLYKQNGDDENSMKKIGVTVDAMKGIEYEVNLALHFTVDDNGVWEYETTKVQGALGAMFPLNKKGKKIDFEKLFAYTEKTLKPSDEKDEDEEEVITRTAEKAEQPSKKKTQADLVTLARSYGIEPKALGEILKGAGFTGYNPDQHEAMEKAITDYVAAQA